MPDQKVNWNLDHILKLEDFDKQYKKIERSLKKYEDYFKQMKPSMAVNKFKEFIDFDEKLGEEFYRLYDMPALMEAVDQKDETAKLYKTKATNLSLQMSDISRPIWHWLKGKEVSGKKSLDSKNAKRLFKSLPNMQYVLERMRESAKHTLSQEEEKIISKKNSTGVDVLLDLRSVIETEQRFEFKPKGEKAMQIETQSQLMTYVYSNNKNHREAAYKALFDVYKDNLQKYFMIYQSIVKDWGHMAQLRGYDSPISVRNFSNDVADEVIDVLIEVCRDNRKVFQDYFKYKAKLLGVKKLRRYDIYAPVLDIEEEQVPYQKAVELVLDTFYKFGRTFHDHAKRIIDDEHVDSHPSSVKQSGAFCATIVPSISPYILLNYMGRSRDIMVLAHELGHGVHSLYAAHLPMSSQHAPLPLAETASTLAEMVVFERLLAQEDDPKVKKHMLMDKLADAYATIMRQIYFLIFEKEAHTKLQDGITPEELSDIYFSTLKEQFGTSLDLDDNFRYEWSYIPHMVRSPFYVYSYSFGELLSLALYSIYKQEGSQFISQIEKVLTAGGSQNPQKLLKSVGVDITDKAFWQGSFDIIKGWLKEVKSQ